ncbi:MAG: hypothetical protein HQK58_00755 [Deltaproteobacteria bacterium]|nr:hypothetical protein [Deltaproteobacteria bacterium]
MEPNRIDLLEDMVKRLVAGYRRLSLENEELAIQLGKLTEKIRLKPQAELLNQTEKDRIITELELLIKKIDSII